MHHAFVYDASQSQILRIRYAETAHADSAFVTVGTQDDMYKIGVTATC